MERCDFASITAILRENLMDGSFENQVGFVSALFESYIQENEVYFDNGLLNRWLNGLAKVSPAIGQYYHDDPAHRRELAETLRDRILTRMADSAMAVKAVHALLLQDESVSDEKKAALCGRLCSEDGNDADFLADVLVFGIVRRPFVARDIRKSDPFPADISTVPLCVRPAGGGGPCQLHCGNIRENSGQLDMFTGSIPDSLLSGPGAGLCESILRMVWEVAHLQDWDDFEHGLHMLYEMEQVFIRDGNHALLGALSRLLRTMSSLRSSVEDTAQAQLEYDRARYIHRVAGNVLHFRMGGGEQIGCRDHAEPKANRGPPLRKCVAFTSYCFYRAVSEERRAACAPQFSVNSRSISAQ